MRLPNFEGQQKMMGCELIIDIMNYGLGFVNWCYQTYYNDNRLINYEF